MCVYVYPYLVCSVLFYFFNVLEKIENVIPKKRKVLWNVSVNKYKHYL